jgi:hypothetical protein
VAVAGTANTRLLPHRSAGNLVRWIEAAVSDPLPDHHVWRQRGEFAEQLDCADLGDAGDTCQQIVSLPYAVVASDQRHGLATQFENPLLARSKNPLQIVNDTKRR